MLAVVRKVDCAELDGAPAAGVELPAWRPHVSQYPSAAIVPVHPAAVHADPEPCGPPLTRPGAAGAGGGGGEADDCALPTDGAGGAGEPDDAGAAGVPA